MIAHDCYGETKIGQVSYLAHHVLDQDLYRSHLSAAVKERLFDTAQLNIFESDLNALSTTRMATDTIAAILGAPTHTREGWEVGEAWAEVDLETRQNVVLPWNMSRDKRSPRASLQGADLVGFKIESSKDCVFAFGEVKTSGCTDAPPSVMAGRSGMISQLQTLCTDLDTQRTLLIWLNARCRGTQFSSYFEQAAKRYLNSKGLDCYLFGYLMRDTDHNELDLKNRAEALALSVKAPTQACLFAWYFPSKIDDWYGLMVK